MTGFSAGNPNFNQMLDRIEKVEGGDLDLRTPDYADFPGREFGRRYSRLRILMEDQGIDLALLSQEENVRYFTGYLTVLWVSRFRPLVGLLPRDPGLGAGVVVSHQEMGNALATSWVPRPVSFPAQEPPIPFIVREIRERSLDRSRIGIELGFGQRLGMNLEQWRELVTSLPEATFLDITPLTQAVRMLKSPMEIERIRRACAISEGGVRAGWEAVHEGTSEREIVQIMSARMAELGAEVGSKPSFFGVLAGERWQLANAVASEYRVKAGDLILVDGGGTYRGYTCDFIRQACVGRCDLAQRRWFDAVIGANQAAVAAVRPGVTAEGVYAAALQYLSERGMADGNRMNIIGHGIGMDVHELPWLGEQNLVYSSETTLRSGMTLCIEPGVVSPSGDPPGQFIVEDVILVTTDGARVLTDTLGKQVWEVPVRAGAESGSVRGDNFEPWR
jgi:Xaa-Pro dipeptidase